MATYVTATNFKVGFAVAEPVPGDLNSNLKYPPGMTTTYKLEQLSEGTSQVASSNPTLPPITGGALAV